jgi:hypothetical protein
MPSYKVGGLEPGVMEEGKEMARPEVGRKSVVVKGPKTRIY